MIVLAASPIESVRLLLNSVSNKHPNGLGNSSGLLGRYFMDQLPCLAFATYPPAKGWTLDRQAPGILSIIRAAAYSFRDLVMMMRPRRLQLPRQRWPHPGSGRQHARLSLFGFGRMLPHADNRITLDPKRKDAWGIAVPHIRCVMKEDEYKLLEQQERTLIELVECAGGELEFIGSPTGLKEMGQGAFPDTDPVSRFLFRKWFKKTMCMVPAIHETGGARMGSDPAQSVLNPYNQLWDAPNVAVVDASAFAGSGTVGTTLTVMALALTSLPEFGGAISRLNSPISLPSCGQKTPETGKKGTELISVPSPIMKSGRFFDKKRADDFDIALTRSENFAAWKIEGGFSGWLPVYGFQVALGKTVNHAFQTDPVDRAGTHGTGLGRGINRALGKKFSRKGSRGAGHQNAFGVTRHVMIWLERVVLGHDHVTRWSNQNSSEGMIAPFLALRASSKVKRKQVS